MDAGPVFYEPFTIDSAHRCRRWQKYGSDLHDASAPTCILFKAGENLSRTPTSRFAFCLFQTLQRKENDRYAWQSIRLALYLLNIVFCNAIRSVCYFLLDFCVYLFSHAYVCTYIPSHRPTMKRMSELFQICHAPFVTLLTLHVYFVTACDN